MAKQGKEFEKPLFSHSLQLKIVRSSYIIEN